MQRIALIDAGYMFRRNWHGAERSSTNTAFEATLNEVTAIADEYDHVAVCADFPPYWRKELDPEYKAQRGEPDPTMFEQQKRLYRRLKDDGLHVVCAKGFEADDIIATLATQAPVDETEVVIVSPDKDLFQLVGPFTKQVDPGAGNREGKLYDAPAVREKLGILPKQVPDYLALTGDASDNIKGAPGVGPKTAAQLISEFETLDRIIEVAKERVEQDDKPKKVHSSMVEAEAQIRLARRLVELRTDAPVNIETIFTKPEPKPIAEELKMPAAAPETEAQFEEPKAEKPKANGAAIVKASSFDKGLEPAGLEQATVLARYLHDSRLFARSFHTPQAVLAIIVAGRELGLGAMTSLQNFHLIEGKPTMAAHLIMALAMQHRACEYFQCVESNERQAIYVTKRKGNPEPSRLTYTIEQADRAGLLEVKEGKKPGNWHKRPDEMLRKTCGVMLARLVYPEVATGMYCPEEMGAEAND